MGNLLDSVSDFVSDNKAEIALGAGIAAGIIGGIFAWRNGSKAKATVIKKRAEAEVQHKDYTKFDAVKDTAKYWAPPVGMFALSIGAVITSNRIQESDKAFYATAYGAATTAFTEYQKKVVETIGEKKEGKIRDAIMEEQARTTPMAPIVITGDGDYLCYESITKTYFRSSQVKVEKAINDLNHDMSFGNEPYKTVNEYLSAIGLEDMGSEGDQLGWCAESKIEAKYTYIGTETGEPCMCIGFFARPGTKFDKYRGY